MSAAPLKIFLAAGESSGDQLGAKLMGALRAATGGAVEFRGVGGPAMQGEGLASLFPASDIAVMGPRAVIARLPLILRRLRETVAAVESTRPDILVIVDSPEFTQRVAKRVRALEPDLPIVKYVAPQVWAWRPGRAPRMRRYIDHILGLLPFEPEYYARLGGPPTSYVGHPLIEVQDRYRPSPEEAARRADRAHPCILVLPGSRVSEVSRLIDGFGETIALVAGRHGPVEPVIPAVPHLAGLIREKVRSWPVTPRVVEGEGRSSQPSAAPARRWRHQAPSPSSSRSPACRASLLTESSPGSPRSCGGWSTTRTSCSRTSSLGGGSCRISCNGRQRRRRWPRRWVR